MKKDLWKKLASNWSWVDTAVGFVVGAFVSMVITMFSLGMHKGAMDLLNAWSSEIVKLFLITVLLGRMLAVARWPRNPPLDYNKISPAGALAAHFLTIIIGLMLLIITLALVAPGVLELLAKHYGDSNGG